MFRPEQLREGTSSGSGLTTDYLFRESTYDCDQDHVGDGTTGNGVKGGDGT